MPATVREDGVEVQISPQFFRNVTTTPSTPIDDWPHEVFRAVLEYGMVYDWRIVADFVRAHPWGKAAHTLEEVIDYSDDLDTYHLMKRILHNARADAQEGERQQVASELASYVRQSGMTQKDFALATGTSASRLSSYISGKTDPRASYVVRARAAALNT
ncbi:MAG: helix-turn-helix domain-containing protein [Ancrocorticia sp.]|uniref:helix-turn-helix domain-containing protein n=1 Tax=Ancrocorticia sp. TaxID=2593684 RepID=UPI003F92F90D